MRRTRRTPLVLCPLFCVLLLPLSVFAAGHHCTGVYVGRGQTASGAVILGQIGDEASSHWVELVPARTHPEDAAIEVGVDAGAVLPGVRSHIPQVRRTARYLTVRYTEYLGVPAPLENGGINQHGVAVVDVWSPSRKELVEMTPKDQKGLNYSDEARIAMERARTAREAVELLGGLIDRYGHATYGGNTHLVADAREGWVMEEFAGGEGLWVARRLGPDEIRVHGPGWFGELPRKWRARRDYLGAKHLVSFAVEQGWYEPEQGTPFNVSEVYEADRDVRGVGLVKDHPERPGHQARSHSVVRGEQFLKMLAPEVRIEHVMELFRMRPYSNRKSKYAQVTELKRGTPPELLALWVALAPPETGIWVPFYLGMESIPPEFGKHRYLSSGEAERVYLPREDQAREATRDAFRAFDRLYMLSDMHRGVYQSWLIDLFRAREKRLIEEQKTVEQTALALLRSGKRELARRYLTYYASTEALAALGMAERLGKALELMEKGGRR